jgi:hypothetical protein
MKAIAQALVKAQKSFAPALKTNTNPHFKSKYVGLDGCVEAVIDALNDNGIFLLQGTHECDDGVIIETVFIHESGEQLSAGKLHVPAAKNDPQGYGSALTYARRYSLMAACGIAPEDDDGNAAKPYVKTSKPVANIGYENLKKAAAKGTAAFREAWKSTKENMRPTDHEIINELKAIADSADSMIATQA